jgi:hypothetical protein
MNRLPKRKKSDKYTKSAENQKCQLAFNHNCNNETVIFAHIGGGGMGAKRQNIHGAYCCLNAHDILDGRVQSDFSKDELLYYHLLAMLSTQDIMLRNRVLLL